MVLLGMEYSSIDSSFPHRHKTEPSYPDNDRDFYRESPQDSRKYSYSSGKMSLLTMPAPSPPHAAGSPNRSARTRLWDAAPSSSSSPATPADSRPPHSLPLPPSSPTGFARGEPAEKIALPSIRQAFPELQMRIPENASTLGQGSQGPSQSQNHGHSQSLGFMSHGHGHSRSHSQNYSHSRNHSRSHSLSRPSMPSPDASIASTATTTAPEYVCSPTSSHKRQRIHDSSSTLGDVPRLFPSNHPGHPAHPAHPAHLHPPSPPLGPLGSLDNCMASSSVSPPVSAVSSTTHSSLNGGGSTIAASATTASSVSTNGGHSHSNSASSIATAPLSNGSANGSSLPGLTSFRYDREGLPRPAGPSRSQSYTSEANDTYRSYAPPPPPPSHPSSHPPHPPHPSQQHPLHQHQRDEQRPQSSYQHHPHRGQSQSLSSIRSFDRAAFPSSSNPSAGPSGRIYGASISGPPVPPPPTAPQYMPNPPHPSSGSPPYHLHSQYSAAHRDYVPVGELRGLGLAGAAGGALADSKQQQQQQQRKRRGNLPKETTDKLRAWFVAHLHHPYPSEDEKQELMRQTGLQMNQISNWFINARRRQLPTMINNARIESDAMSSSRASMGAGGQHPSMSHPHHLGHPVPPHHAPHGGPMGHHRQNSSNGSGSSSSSHGIPRMLASPERALLPHPGSGSASGPGEVHPLQPHHYTSYHHNSHHGSHYASPNGLKHGSLMTQEEYHDMPRHHMKRGSV